MHPGDSPSYHRYLRHAELLAAIDALADRRPGWLSRETLLTTPEGREMVAVTVTDPRTGAPEDKPAFYMDGNIHARELPGGAVCLGLLHKLIEGADDPQVAALLEDFTFYVVPRVAVDGVEALLEGRAFPRSAPRPWPDDEPPRGLVPRDLDGDGHVREMRIPDPSGGWMVDPRDPRLMVPRPLDATEGTFYRIIPEGIIEGEDPRLLRSARDPHGVDFNRNFPAFWRVEGEQKGAGPHPLSEPETLALARFISGHRNICGVQALHSGIEVVIPPEGVTPYDKFADADKALFEELGARGEALMGIAFSSIMTYGYGECAGDFGEWCFAHRGIPSLVVELWSVEGRAGVSLKEQLAARSTRPHLWPDLELKSLEWATEHLGEGAFAGWRPFEHPQLGPVEIGGWQRGLHWIAPEGPQLASIVERAVAFALTHAAASPRLRWVECGARAVSAGLYVVSALVENGGHLPTWLSARGKALGVIEPVRAAVSLPEGASLELGRPRQELGHLGGRGQRALVEWLVRGDEGAEVGVEIAAEKGGVLRRSVVLGA